MKVGEVGFAVGKAVSVMLGLREGRIEGFKEGLEVIGCKDGENPFGSEQIFDPGNG